MMDTKYEITEVNGRWQVVSVRGTVRRHVGVPYPTDTRAQALADELNECIGKATI